MARHTHFVLEVINEWCTLPKFRGDTGSVVDRRIQLDRVDKENSPAHTLFDEHVKDPFRFADGILGITKTNPESVQVQWVYLGSGGHSCLCRRNHIVSYYSWKIPATKKNRALLDAFDGLTMAYGPEFHARQRIVIDAVIKERERYEKMEAEEKLTKEANHES